MNKQNYSMSGFSIKRFIVIICMFSSLMFSCENKKDMPLLHSKKAVSNNNDSASHVFLLSINEPDIKELKTEAYRFFWSRTYKENYLFRIQKSSNGKPMLFSKCILEGASGLTVIYKGSKVELNKDTVIEQRVQEINEQSLSEFKKILEGSYYWALDNPCPNGDGATDGSSLILESNSYSCGNYFELNYHIVSVHNPKNGSFRNAFEFLLALSDLTKNNRELKKELQK